MLYYKERAEVLLGGRAWLRSGNNNNAYNAYALLASGANPSVNTAATTSYAVRPALHSLARKMQEIFPYPTRTLTVGQI